DQPQAAAGALQTLSGIDEPARLADTIAAHISVQYVKTNRKLPPERCRRCRASMSRRAWPTPSPRTSAC
ncbi:hypothetical protein C7E17_27230, partial [Stenotrophomonas maltophilia]